MTTKTAPATLAPPPTLEAVLERYDTMLSAYDTHEHGLPPYKVVKVTPTDATDEPERVRIEPERVRIEPAYGLLRVRWGPDMRGRSELDADLFEANGKVYDPLFHPTVFFYSDTELEVMDEATGTSGLTPSARRQIRARALRAAAQWMRENPEDAAAWRAAEERNNLAQRAREIRRCIALLRAAMSS